MATSLETTAHQTTNPGTERKDNWWQEPLLVFLGLGIFIVYATWAAFQGNHYEVEGTQYLSPFYAPNLRPFFEDMGWGLLAGLSPAFFILWAPAGFRTTCYYYRKAYYRSFFTQPVGCAVNEIKSPLAFLLGKGKTYRGEQVFPMVLQNLHRFFFYIAVLFIVFLSYDALLSFWFPGQGVGIGVGSLVLTINVILLAAYTFGCHSYRHLLGGNIDCFSCSPVSEARHHAWKRQTFLNEHHMLFAWLSLFTVGFADLYIRLVSMGIWQDFVYFPFS